MGFVMPETETYNFLHQGLTIGMYPSKMINKIKFTLLLTFCFVGKYLRIQLI